MKTCNVTLPVKCEKFLTQLAEEHQVDLTRVLGELCAWAFSNNETRKQFKTWLNEAFPPKGAAEDEARSRGMQERAREEMTENAYEEESHEDRNYSEDKI